MYWTDHRRIRVKRTHTQDRGSSNHWSNKSPCVAYIWPCMQFPRYLRYEFFYYYSPIFILVSRKRVKTIPFDRGPVYCIVYCIAHCIV